MGIFHTDKCGIFWHSQSPIVPFLPMSYCFESRSWRLFLCFLVYVNLGTDAKFCHKFLCSESWALLPVQNWFLGWSFLSFGKIIPKMLHLFILQWISFHFFNFHLLVLLQLTIPRKECTTYHYIHSAVCWFHCYIVTYRGRLFAGSLTSTPKRYVYQSSKYCKHTLIVRIT